MLYALNNINIYNVNIYMSSIIKKYKLLKFGHKDEDKCNECIVNIIDKDDKETDLIGVTGPLFTHERLNELLKTKKLIGLSAYENFPQKFKNPHNQKRE